jgi:unsaturated chondroitin disaccharide hydrolase
MNLPLLYWASIYTNSHKYAGIARKHMETCLRYSIRADGSTFHTVFMDPQTGEMQKGVTCQGYDDDSFWARGQAWAVYGLALCYRYEKKSEYLRQFSRILNFYLSKLPDDMVPFWDMIFDLGADEPRDSSSASIVVCGLLEMADIVEEREAGPYIRLAKQMIKVLADDYSVKDPNISNGLVLHATYSKKSPYNTCTPEGVDECASWGDYFYFEALTRLSKKWNSYW